MQASVWNFYCCFRERNLLTEKSHNLDWTGFVCIVHRPTQYLLVCSCQFWWIPDKICEYLSSEKISGKESALEVCNTVAIPPKIIRSYFYLTPPFICKILSKSIQFPRTYNRWKIIKRNGRSTVVSAVRDKLTFLPPPVSTLYRLSYCISFLRQ